MSYFLKVGKISDKVKPTQDEMDNQDSPISIAEIKLVVKNLI